MGSKQMQQIRMSLRGKAVVLMGKNTMMRKAIRGHLENNPALEKSVDSPRHLCSHFSVPFSLFLQKNGLKCDCLV